MAWLNAKSLLYRNLGIVSTLSVSRIPGYRPYKCSRFKNVVVVTLRLLKLFVRNFESRILTYNFNDRKIKTAIS